MMNKDDNRRGRNSLTKDDGGALVPVETALTTLQPLRDLVKNWDIDIASCLEEYLQDLLNVLTPEEQTRINPNAAATAKSLNFSQAALVLQNSSNVYSRKVEYLYTLVYKALEELSNKPSSQQKRPGAAASNNSEDVNAFYNYDPNVDFLLLDDVIPISDKINLQEKGSANGTSNQNNNASMISNGTRWSLGGGASIIGINTTSGTFSSDSTTQQQLALLLATDTKTAASVTLRLLDGQCDIAEGGVLLMPGTALPPQQQQDTVSPRSSTMESGTNIHVTDPDLNPDNDNDPFQEHNGTTTAVVADASITTPENMDIDAGFDDHNDYDGGSGCALNDDFHNNNAGHDTNNNDDDARNYQQDVERTLDHPQHTPTDQVIDEQQQQQQHDDETSNNHKTVKFATEANKNNKVKKKVKNDPWELLDPHTATTSTRSSRPLKIGKTYKLPQGIRNLPSECVTGARTRQNNKNRRRQRKQDRQSSILGLDTGMVVTLVSSTFQSVLANQKRLSFGGNYNVMNTNHDNSMISLDCDEKQQQQQEHVINILSKIPLNQLIFGTEFHYIAKATAKRKAAEKRQQRLNDDAADENRIYSQNDVPEENYNANNYDDEGYQNIDFDYGGDNNDSYGDNNDEEGGGDGGMVLGNTGRLSIEGAFADSQEGDIYNPDNGNDLDNDNSNSPQQTFEELCRAHIRAFAKGAARYATETNLTKRVGDWHHRLLPILNDEESRPEYDIHKYKTRVVTNIEQELQNLSNSKSDMDTIFRKKKDVVDFNAVTADSEHYDVCRLFLASLSLCNSGNVVFKQKPSTAKGNKIMNNDKDLSCIGIQLLNTEIERPTETYNNIDENDENVLN